MNCARSWGSQDGASMDTVGSFLQIIALLVLLRRCVPVQGLLLLFPISPYLCEHLWAKVLIFCWFFRRWENWDKTVVWGHASSVWGIVREVVHLRSVLEDPRLLFGLFKLFSIMLGLVGLGFVDVFAHWSGQLRVWFARELHVEVSGGWWRDEGFSRDIYFQLEEAPSWAVGA